MKVGVHIVDNLDISVIVPCEIITEFQINNQQHTTVTLTSTSQSHSLSDLIDSGAGADFMDYSFTTKLNLEPVPLDSLLIATALDRRVL